MAVRLRLMRMGKTKQPVYRVVVMDQRAPRDGRYIEQIGRYDARQEPSLVEIDNERATEWLAKGAQPSETVEKLLNVSGAMNTMKIKTGGIHVVGVHKDTPTEKPAEDTASSEDSESAEPVVSQDSEADAPAATQSSEPDDPESGGGSRGVAPPDSEAETDDPAATPSSETDDPAEGGGSRGVAPPDNETAPPDNQEEE